MSDLYKVDSTPEFLVVAAVEEVVVLVVEVGVAEVSSWELL